MKERDLGRAHEKGVQLVRAAPLREFEVRWRSDESDRYWVVTPVSCVGQALLTSYGLQPSSRVVTTRLSGCTRKIPQFPWWNSQGT